VLGAEGDNRGSYGVAFSIDALEEAAEAHGRVA
jgi:hypothetical protein